MDDTGALYVTGNTQGKDRLFRFSTVKYSGTGKLLWVSHYTGEESSFSFARALSLDNKRNVYVLGWSGARNIYSNFLITIKYDGDGNQGWVARYRDSQEKRGITPNAIELDRAGNVYVTGYVSVSPWQSGPPPMKAEFVTIKYDNNGKQQWVAKYERPQDHETWIYDLKVDARGNVYAIGSVGVDALIIKYDANGNEKKITRLKTMSELAKFLSALSRS